MSDKRILVASSCNAWKKPYDNQNYEFGKIILGIDDADLLVPEAGSAFSGRRELTATYLRNELLRRTASKLRSLAGRPRVPMIEPVDVEGEYDLFFFPCQYPNDLAELQHIRGWRKRCRKSAALIMESWSTRLERHRAELRLLDDFDHVFILNRTSIPSVQRYTRTPCSFLSTATDCLAAAPYPNPPERTIDVYCMGRRPPVVHARLVEMAERDEIFYVYDAWGDGTVIDWNESRLMTRTLIKRCRYFIAYDHSVGNTPKAQESAGESSLSTRYFEGAAGGAVMIGSAPPCPEFRELFDWPDAVIAISPEPEDMRAVLADLEARSEHLDQVRRVNVTQSLRRHDWAHRWRQVLATFDMAPSPKLLDRLAQLDRLAETIEASAHPQRRVA